jgi:putative membrane protein
MYLSPGMGTILHWCVSAFAFLVTAYVIPGFEVGSFVAALIAAAVYAFANMTVGMVLKVITLPLSIVTFGIFFFVVDAIVLKMCAAVVPKFNIKSWWSAFFGALLLSLSNSILHYYLI